MNSEQRKDARFQPQGQTFAILRPHFTKLGKLIDISRGGLSFQYLACQGQKEDATQLDILISDNNFYLSRIPCKIIYEIEQSTISNFKNKRLGVQFGELTQKQANLLELYLKDHAIKKLKRRRSQR